MKKLISIILILGMLLCAAPVYADDALNLKAESAILIDMTTGKVLYEKNADTRLMPTSTAKMLTAYLGITNLDMNEYVTVKAEEIEGITGGGLDLYANETLGMGTMISAMVLTNANDAAYVVANRVSGSVEAFVELMNETAKEIGCENTNFTNPAGTDDENQYSTAEDLAKIASYCMQNEVFRRVVSKETLVIEPTNVSQYRYLSNNNLLLYDETPSSRVYVNNVLRFCKYEGCIGIQSGYSSGAGACLVSAVTKQDTTLLAVVLRDGATERYADSIKLYDYGFENFKTVKVLDDGYNAGTIAVKKGTVLSVPLAVEDISYVTIPANAKVESLATYVTLDEFVVAPAPAGTKVGTLKVMSDIELVAEYDVVTAEDVELGGFFARMGFNEMSVKKIVAIIVLCALVLAGLIVLLILVDRKRTIQRKAARAIKRQEIEQRDLELRLAWEKNHPGEEYGAEIANESADEEQDDITE